MSNELFEAARRGDGPKAHAPYSQFPVGAAVRGENGNGSTPVPISRTCPRSRKAGAPRQRPSAHLIMAGRPQASSEVAVIAEKMPALHALRRLPPAAGGICRCRAPRIFHLCDNDGIVKKTVTPSAELLPHSPSRLGCPADDHRHVRSSLKAKLAGLEPKLRPSSWDPDWVRSLRRNPRCGA